MVKSEMPPAAPSLVTRLVGALLLFLVSFGAAQWALGFLEIVPGAIRAVGLMLAAGCFLLGSFALVFTGISRNKVLLWLSGIAVVLVVVLIGTLTLAALYIVNNPILLLVVLPVSALAFHLYKRSQGPRLSDIGPEVTTRRSKPNLTLSAKRILSSKVLISAIEVVGMPESYLGISKDIKETPKDHQPFRNLMRTLTLSGIPVSLRLEHLSGHTRILYLTWSKSPTDLSRNRTALLDALRSNLPEFDVRSLEDHQPPKVSEKMVSALATLEGEPLTIEDQRQRGDPLTIVADVLRYVENVVLQISSLPYCPSSSELRSLEHQYEQEMGRAQRTVSSPKRGLFSDGAQSSAMVVDARSLRGAGQTQRDIERYSSKYLCKVSATVACWSPDQRHAEASARRIGESLMGAIVPITGERDFQLKMTRNRRSLADVMMGLPAGRQTVLTPEEATVYFVLPHSALGIRVTRRNAFALGSTTVQPSVVVEDAPAGESTLGDPVVVASAHNSALPRPATQTVLEPEWRYANIGLILLGFAIGKNGQPLRDRPIAIRKDELDSHFGIFGNTRSGKTTTAKSLVAQASRFGVKSVVLIPYKPDDWMLVLEVDPTARVFIAGGPTSLAFHINPFDVPPKVPILRWISRLIDVFCAWVPADRVIRMHLQDVFFTTYARCGWDLTTGTQGRPVLLSDLYDSMLEVYERLGYGDEVKRNVYGALLARIRAMLRSPAVVSMYNTDKGITIPELLQQTTLIRMDGLSDDDKILLTGLLTAAVAEYRQANPVQEVRNLLVIEEAHFILGRSQVSEEGMPTAQGEAVKNIVTMLRTAGGVGLGIMFLDQLPGSLDSEAFKLVVNSIVHALNDPENKTAGRHARCNDGQTEHISGMAKGEAILFVQRESVPIDVQIVQLERMVQLPPKRPWDLARLEERMRPVFESNSDLSVCLPLAERTRLALDSAPVEKPAADKRPAVTDEQVSTLRLRVMTEEQEEVLRLRIATEAFGRMITTRVAAAQGGDLRPLVSLFLKLGAKFCPADVDRDYFVQRSVALARETYGLPELDGLSDRLKQPANETTGTRGESGA